MRKKFLSAFMVGALALAATSTITSCKDYDGDISSLQEQIKSLESAVNQKEATINSSIQSLQAAIAQANNDHATKAALAAAVAELESAINAKYNTLVEKDAQLSAAIQAALAAADAAAKVAKENTDAIQKVANDLATANEKLNTLSADLQKANADIATLNAALVAQKAELEAALAAQKAELEAADAANLQKALDAVNALKAEVEAADKALEAKIAEEAAKVAEEIEGIKASIDDLQALHNSLAADVAAINNTTIPAIKQDVQAVANDIKAVDAKYEVITAMLANALRSLVYIPNLYVDGIETIEYAFIKDTTLTKQSVVKFMRKRDSETREQAIERVDDYVYTSASKEYVYGPAWPVEYHMNPSTSDASYADVKGWLCREVEVATRAAVKDLGAITSPEKYDNGDALFANKNGILTAGLKIEKPKALLANGPEGYDEGETGNLSYGKDNIVALQVSSEVGEQDTLITSDYAMLFPEVVHPEAIVWTVDNDRVKLGKGDENVSHSYAGLAEGKCPTADGKAYHIWDTPVEALTHTDNTSGKDVDSHGQPDVLLPWNSTTGIDLKKMIGTHVQKVCAIKNHSVNLQTWKYGEEKKWGLKYIFELVNYAVAENATSDSKYCTLTDGVIVACDVDAEGNSKPGVQNNSIVGREPLVRVRLVDAAEKNTFLDAYILVRITQAKETQQIVINDYPVYNETFDLCNAISFERTTWSQFDAYVLDKLNITKEQFDAQYTLDVTTDPAITLKNGALQYRVNVYSDTNGTLATYTCPTTNNKVEFGSAFYFDDEAGTTNHAFEWALTADELEYLTHDKEALPVNFKQYIRFVGNGSADYEYVYIKFEANIGRAAVPTSKLQDKGNDYWFAADGNDDGWDFIVNNLQYPNSDVVVPTVWRNNIKATFIGGEVKGNGKFFFAPIDTEIVTDHCDMAPEAIGNSVDYGTAPSINNNGYNNDKIHNGKANGREWRITAQSSASDVKWNAFVCHNNICHEGHNVVHNGAGVYDGEYRPTYDQGCSTNLHANATYTTHKWADNATNSKILQSCAIDYNEGCFTNNKLYAVSPAGKYYEIVELNQTTGEFTVIRDDYVPGDVIDYVINAVGYAENHANIAKELHAWVGYVQSNGCGVALDLFQEEGKDANLFRASWQRPLNILDMSDEEVWDAKNNGDAVSILKHLAFFDWRGPVKGNMGKVEPVENITQNPADINNLWLWGFYNIHGIVVDCDMNKVLTDLNGTPGVFDRTLAKASDKVHLAAYKTWDYVTRTGTPASNNRFESFFDLTPYASPLQNANMAAWMVSNIEKFGYIFYENNGENVTDFSVKIPITVYYEWGHFDTYLTIKINRTLGN